MAIDSVDSRKLLDIALGDKPVETIQLNKTDTFLDKLPKDVIQYLHQYTGPMDCFYLTHIILNVNNRRVPNFHVWVNRTQQQATQEARNKGYNNNQVTAAKIIFIDGTPYLAQKIEKRKLYGIPKPRKKKKARTSLNIIRCTGKTITNKRCKNRISNVNGKCISHASQ